MTGCPGKIRPQIVVKKKRTNKHLQQFIVSLIDKYISIESHIHDLPYFSDDEPWFDLGYPTAFVHESDEINPVSNTPDDTFEKIDFKHVMRFVKLGLATAIEISHSSYDPKVILWMFLRFLSSLSPLPQCVTTESPFLPLLPARRRNCVEESGKK